MPLAATQPSTGGPRKGGGRPAAEKRGAADDAAAKALDLDAIDTIDALDTIDAAAPTPTAMRVRGGGCVVSKGRGAERVEPDVVKGGTPGPGSPPAKQAQQTPQGEAAVPDAAAAVTDAAAAPDAAAVRKATRKAIKERVALVAAMPEADRAAIGAQYTEAEGLFKAIEGIVMLRGSWLKEQSSESGFRLPKRGTELPAEAIITVDELRAIHKASTCNELRAFHKASTCFYGAGCRHGALPVVTVSQCAKQRSNARPPDRALATAARVHNQSLPRVLSRIAATGAQRRTRTPTARRSTSSSASSKRCGASLRRRA